MKQVAERSLILHSSANWLRSANFRPTWTNQESPYRSRAAPDQMLKQPQYQPVPVEKQVMIIFAATNGYLDDVPVELVGAWENGLYRYMDASH